MIPRLKLTCFFIICFYFQSTAQPVLTTGCQAGETFSYTVAAYLPADSIGSNVTWDFSTLQTTGTDQLHYDTASAGADYADFPGATLMRTTASGQATYFKVTDTVIETLGAELAGNSAYTGTLPEKTSHFPFAYGQIFIDSFVDSFYGSHTGIRHGLDTTIADGWGTLLLPGGRIYTNVLKVHLISHYVDSISSQPVVTTVDERNYFYDTVIHSYLLAVINAHGTADGAPPLTSQAAYYYNDPATAVGTLNPGDQVTVSPVPVTGSLSVDLPAKTGKEIKLTIKNSIGQLVKEAVINAGNRHTAIDCTNLPPGIYFLSFNNGSTNTVKKIVKA